MYFIAKIGSKQSSHLKSFWIPAGWHHSPRLWWSNFSCTTGPVTSSRQSPF